MNTLVDHLHDDIISAKLFHMFFCVRTRIKDYF